MMSQLCQRLKLGDRIASFGYPDIIGDITQYTSRTPAYRPESHAICKRHRLAEHLIPDAHSFFEIMGAKLDVYDIVKERGCEILCDLNEKYQSHAWNYDFVLDVGTAEHCFNIGQAITNMAETVKVGGFILHENPFNWGNHGFYNLNPTFFTDFYEQNGFKVLECVVVGEDWIARPPRAKRFRLKRDSEATIFTISERVELVGFKWPTQDKYKKLLG